MVLCLLLRSSKLTLMTFYKALIVKTFNESEKVLICSFP